MQAGFVFWGFLFTIPFYLRAFFALTSPLALDASGTHLAGHFRSWQVASVTGRVGGTSAYTTTTATTTYTQNAYGTTDKSTSVSSSLHQGLLLVDAAGQQHSFGLTDFHLQVFDGQIVSVCTAAKGRKQAVVAVLNHSTRLQFTERRQLNQILHPRPFLIVVWLLFAIIFSTIGSLELMFLIVFVAMFTMIVANRTAHRRFSSTGIQSLWTNTAVAAAALT